MTRPVNLIPLFVIIISVLAQDVTNITSGETPASTSPSLTGSQALSAASFPSGIPTSSPTITSGATPSAGIQCYIPLQGSQSSEENPVKENTSNLPALPTGVECYKIGSDGILDGTPFTTIGDPGVTDFPRSSSTAGGALSSGSSSSSSNLKVVLPAVLGSVVVGCLLVVLLLWLRHSRKRTATRRQSMRAWVLRPGGWVREGNAFGDQKEERQNDIALHERQPSYV